MEQMYSRYTSMVVQIAKLTNAYDGGGVHAVDEDEWDDQFVIVTTIIIAFLLIISF